MNELRDKLTTSVFTTNAANHIPVHSFGIVTKANEKENICTITYQNGKNKVETVENVEVKISTKNENWFPKVGELVETEEASDNKPIITGLLIRDYVREVKQDRTYKKDVLPDNKGTVRGKVT